MNQDNQKSRQIAVLNLLRQGQDSAAKLEAEFIQLLNVNETDGRLLNLLQLNGRQTAGELATKSGLTTGAITTALDRLEKANYVQRERDTKDRRKVFVELTPLARNIGGQIYGPIGSATLAHLKGFSEDQLQTIEKFLRLFDAVNAKGAEILKDTRWNDPNDKMKAAEQFNQKFNES